MMPLRSVKRSLGYVAIAASSAAWPMSLVEAATVHRTCRSCQSGASLLAFTIFPNDLINQAIQRLKICASSG
jgi:hypothetical protein